ncbi:hypothetical protein EB796_006470 [Bugula neritina]|uniref:Uncharacterized protein n=1 Tax=Bugula neritina TaxID=10212 RepID=A0A7J7KAI7_BUGNE|nr:hypothetical protein EB796_006470 [Bugula neritina]
MKLLFTTLLSATCIFNFTAIMFHLKLQAFQLSLCWIKQQLIKFSHNSWLVVQQHQLTNVDSTMAQLCSALHQKLCTNCRHLCCW